MRYYKQLQASVLGGIMIIILLSCNASRNIMFKTGEQGTASNSVVSSDSNTYRHRISADDRIVIRFLNNIDLEKNNLSSIGTATAEESGFLVDFSGNVTLPIIGRTELGGLTRLEAAKKLEVLYSKYIVNPIIDVTITNLSVSVLGEVRMPGSYKLNKENTTLIEVLAMAGGPTEYGKIYNIKIIRGNLKSPQIIEVDLGKTNTLKNPDIIIHDKDIVYVEPVKNKLRGATIAGLSPYFIVLTSISTLILAFSAIK